MRDRPSRPRTACKGAPAPIPPCCARSVEGGSMRRRGSCALTAVAVAVLVPAVAVAADAGSVRSLDGSAQQPQPPRLGPCRHAVPAGRRRPTTPTAAPHRSAGPAVRYVSNRIFNDTAQNLFSENGVTQWGAVWGQFLDHTFGLRQETGGERAPIAFDAADPLEAVPQRLRRDRLRAHAGRARNRAVRAAPAAEHVGGYIDASDRLRRLRRSGCAGCVPVDGARRRQAAAARRLSATRRRLAATPPRAPPMALMGRLLGSARPARSSPATCAPTRTSR